MDNMRNFETPDEIRYYNWEGRLVKDVYSMDVSTRYILLNNGEWTEEGVPNDNIIINEALVISDEDAQIIESQIIKS